MTEDIKRKIAVLRRKADDAGASEAEAMAAAEKAAELMRKHGLTDEDVEFDEQAAPIKTKGRSVRDALWGTVGRCTNSAPVLDTAWDPVITFVGHAPGPEIACYLVDVLNRAIDREIAGFKASSEYKRRRTLRTKRAAVHDFTDALVLRLRVRLLDLFQDSMSEQHFDQAKQVLGFRFGTLGTIQTRRRRTEFSGAASAGYLAGGRVQLAHGVNGAATIKQIGRA
ncbi:MAG: DUF2786 domain-containing protein [Pseudodonghicola sp.]